MAFYACLNWGTWKCTAANRIPLHYTKSERPINKQGIYNNHIIYI